MINRKRSSRLQAAALIVLAAVLPGELIRAEQLVPGTSQLREKSDEQSAIAPLGLTGNQQSTSPGLIQDSYILGPGDALVIELLDIPEYSGTFTISPDGTLYLPRLRALHVEGLTLEDLRSLLTDKFGEYVVDPQVFVSPAAYRPIRIYVGGEVQRPGYYFLSGQVELTQPGGPRVDLLTQQVSKDPSRTDFQNARLDSPAIGGIKVNPGLRLPTVFDALRTAGGVTPHSKLSEVSVTRKRPLSSGGGKIRAKLNFLSLITNGDETHNIRLFDGDTVVVARSPVELREQIIQAGKTNLSPDFIQVFVTGRVRDPGSKVLPQGATLDQALASAGGQRLLRGQVEFIRFNRDGSTDRRKFFASGNNPAGSPKNPVLMAGDVISVNDSPLSATVTVLNEITRPAIGIYSAYSLFGSN